VARGGDDNSASPPPPPKWPFPDHAVLYERDPRVFGSGAVGGRTIKARILLKEAEQAEEGGLLVEAIKLDKAAYRLDL